MDNEDEDDIHLVDVWDETSDSKMRSTRVAKAHLNSFMAFMDRKDSAIYVQVGYTCTISWGEYVGKLADFMIRGTFYLLLMSDTSCAHICKKLQAGAAKKWKKN